MSCPRNCSVSASLDQEWLEERGEQALKGTLSWRQAVTGTSVRGEALKKHMEAHVVAAAVAVAQDQAQDELDGLILEARQGLMEQFRMAPPDVAPLILVAIQNLDGLRNTKPSMETLIRALKTVQEMTGMKNEQRMLLNFGAAMFKPKPLVVVNEAAPKQLEGGEST